MARRKAPKTNITDGDPVFPRFNLFPWEIRRMVWEQALPPPIPQALIYKPADFPRWDPKTETWDATDGPPTIPIPPPALLHTTEESRAFVLEHVLIRKVKKARTRCAAPSAYHHIVSRPFNRDTDALFVHEEHFPAFLGEYMASTPWAARHLVFDADIFYYGDQTHAPNVGWFEFSPLADRCRGLWSVALVELRRCDARLDAGAVAEECDPGGGGTTAPCRMPRPRRGGSALARALPPSSGPSRRALAASRGRPGPAAVGFAALLVRMTTTKREFWSARRFSFSGLRLLLWRRIGLRHILHG